MKIKKNKIWVIYIMVIVSSLGILLFYKIKEQEKYQLLKNYNEKVEQDIREVENNIRELQRTLQYLSKSPVIQKVLSNQYTDNLKANNDMSENIETHLWYLITRKNRNIDSIEIFSFDTKDDVGDFIYSQDKAIEKSWYREVQEDKKPILYKKDKSVYLVYPIFKLNYPKILGAIEVRLDIDNITKNIREEGRIASFELFLGEDLIKGSNSDIESYKVIGVINEMNLKLIYKIKRISMLEGAFSLLLIILFYTVLIVVMTFQYNKFLHKEHLQILEERKKRAHLENMVLKAQISPHFLYNIISMINWKAKYSGQDEISEICIELSEFYRTALNKGLDEISLGEELCNIESYIKLKQKLVEIPFSYEIICNNKQKEYKIINFILQPIVENAILHGIGALEEGGHIKIYVSNTETDIYIKIIDNGNNDIDVGKIFRNKIGYGLRNVDERIKLYYGEGYGISVEKRDEETQFTVKIKNNIETKFSSFV